MLPSCQLRVTATVWACGLLLLLSSGQLAQAQIEEALGQSDSDTADESSAIIAALEDPDVVNELRLDNSQRERIANAVAEFRRQQTELEQAQASRLASISSIGERLRKRAEFVAETRTKTEGLRKQVEQSLLEILNAEQQALLKTKVPSAAAAEVTESTNAARSPVPASQPAPATRSEDAVVSFDDPAQGDNATSAPAGEARLSFNFHGAPWTDVLRLFAEKAKLTLNLKDTPPGEFSYYDSQTYTPTEALDIMNRFLLQDGYILVRHDRFLTVLNTKNGVPPNLIETVTPDELSQRGETEMVRVALPLGDREAAKAAEEIRALLGAARAGRAAGVGRVRRRDRHRGELAAGQAIARTATQSPSRRDDLSSFSADAD